VIPEIVLFIIFLIVAFFILLKVHKLSKKISREIQTNLAERSMRLMSLGVRHDELKQLVSEEEGEEEEKEGEEEHDGNSNGRGSECATEAEDVVKEGREKDVTN